MSEFDQGRPVILNIEGHAIETAGIIAPEAAQQCDLCGTVAELRPYGPNGEAICFDCGMKDKATTERMMRKVMFGEDTYE